MKTFQTTTLHSTKFLSLYSTAYEDLKGNKRDWVWASRGKNKFAVVIAATLNDKLVVIKQFRVPLDKYIYELPAGLIENGLSIKETAKKELKEETGFSIKKILNISPLLASSPGMTSECVYLVCAEATGEVNTKNNEPSEEIEVLLADKKMLEKIINNRKKAIDAKAWFVFNAFLKRSNKVFSIT